MHQTWEYTMNLNHSLYCSQIDAKESTALQGSQVTKWLLTDILVHEVEVLFNMYTYLAIWKMQSYNADAQIGSGLWLDRKNGCHKC